MTDIENIIVKYRADSSGNTREQQVFKDPINFGVEVCNLYVHLSNRFIYIPLDRIEEIVVNKKEGYIPDDDIPF